MYLYVYPFSNSTNNYYHPIKINFIDLFVILNFHSINQYLKWFIKLSTHLFHSIFIGAPSVVQ